MGANGIAYGFMRLQDLFAQRVQDTPTEVIDTAVRESAAMHSTNAAALMATFVEPTIKYQERYRLPIGGEMQPLSQDGTPIPRKGATSYTTGYPMMRAGDSFGMNRETYAKATVAELNERMLDVQTADAKWFIRRILAAIFTNANYTYTDDADAIGDLNVVSLANGDSQNYLNRKAAMVTATNFVAQAAAITDAANPLVSLYSKLSAHPGNTGQYVAYVADNLIDAVDSLAGFREYRPANPLLDYGTNETLLNQSAARYLAFGTEIVGYVNKMVIVRSLVQPDNTIIALATGAGAPLVMRQEPEPELQGLKMAVQQVDSNFRKWDFYRKAGFAVRNRVAVAVGLVGSGSYAIPTGYDIRTLFG